MNSGSGGGTQHPAPRHARAPAPACAEAVQEARQRLVLLDDAAQAGHANVEAQQAQASPGAQARRRQCSTGGGAGGGSRLGSRAAAIRRPLTSTHRACRALQEVRDRTEVQRPVVQRATAQLERRWQRFGSDGGGGDSRVAAHLGALQSCRYFSLRRSQHNLRCRGHHGKRARTVRCLWAAGQRLRLCRALMTSAKFSEMPPGVLAVLLSTAAVAATSAARSGGPSTCAPAAMPISASESLECTLCSAQAFQTQISDALVVQGGGPRAPPAIIPHAAWTWAAAATMWVAQPARTLRSMRSRLSLHLRPARPSILAWDSRANSICLRPRHLQVRSR